MSDWITDRLPNSWDGTSEGDVWVYDDETEEYLIRNYEEVAEGQPWREIDPPPTHVNPKRFIASRVDGGIYFVFDKKIRDRVAERIPTREAAQQIADIYNKAIVETIDFL